MLHRRIARSPPHFARVPVKLRLLRSPPFPARCTRWLLITRRTNHPSGLSRPRRTQSSRVLPLSIACRPVLASHCRPEVRSMFPATPAHVGALGPGCAGPSLLMDPRAAQIHYEHSRRAGSDAAHVPLSGAAPLAVDPADLAEGPGNPRTRTQSPYVTGTSVLAVKYKDGVMLAADMLGSYGSTKRYKDVQRIFKVNNACFIGASGEISDFQYIQKLLDSLATEDFCTDDGIVMSPTEVFSYLSRVMYNRRNKFDPLWNSIVVGGVEKNGEPFLGCIAMNGTRYTDDHVATGFGNHLARPLFRETHRNDMTATEAEELLKKALRVCYYRDKQSINKFQVARVMAQGVEVSAPFSLDVTWDLQHFQNPTRLAPGAW